MTTAQSIASRVQISEVWHHLGGGPLRPAGLKRYRGRAWWRDGNGWSVALDDSRGLWYDHRDNLGGGVLDLVMHVHGGNRQEAVIWLARAAGVVLDPKQVSQKDSAAATQRHQEIKYILPAALRWRRAAVLLAEETLAVLKPALDDPKAEPADPDSVVVIEQHLSRMQHLTGEALAREYESWRLGHPELTRAMVRAVYLRELAEHRALNRYFDQVSGQASIHPIRSSLRKDSHPS